jgi:hypothetical protein
METMNEERIDVEARSPFQIQQEARLSLRDEIARLLNRHSAENGSNTPDFLLAEFLTSSLEAFDTAVREREAWYGRNPSQGPGDTAPTPPTTITHDYTAKPAAGVVRDHGDLMPDPLNPPRGEEAGFDNGRDHPEFTDRQPAKRHPTG